MVTATDPAGEDCSSRLVTITVKNVNEAPMMTGGFTRDSQPEYDDGDRRRPSCWQPLPLAKVVETYDRDGP